jgi:hypothetical protein
MTALRVILVLVAALSPGMILGLGERQDGGEGQVRQTVDAADSSETGSGENHISPFWGSAISQWDHWIVYWAQERELDPDLVAAVIRKESIGRVNAEGPYGAVGLMMVLTAEASGMPWRPNAEQLKQPDVNIRWGTGILKQVIRDSGGDLLMALAAYNGGWDQLYLDATERYANSVLKFYAYAIAARHGYSYQDGKIWTMVLMTRLDGHIQLFQTVTSGHFLAPCFDGALDFRDIYPEMVSAPRTQVAHFVDEGGRDVLIDAWLFVGGLDRHVSEAQAGTAIPTLPRIGHHPSRP